MRFAWLSSFLLLAQSPPLYDQAAALVRGENYAAAIPLLERALATAPNDLRARNLIGIALSASGRAADANRHYTAALKINPNFVPVLKNLANNQIQAGDFASARNLLDSAAKLAPNDPAIPPAQGNAAFGDRDFAAALAAYDRSPALDPNSQLRHASSALRTGAPDRALAILGGNPTTDAHIIRADAHEAAGRTAEAYNTLRAAVAESPRDELPYVKLITLCLDHENYALASEIAAAGLKQIPASHKIRVHRGVMLALQAKPDEAAADFAAAIEINKEDPLAHAALALMQLRNEQPAEAARTARARLKTHPNDALANWLLAEALGNTPEAIAALERSIRTDPNLPRPRVLLGKFHMQANQVTRALPHLETAAKLDPQNRYAYAQALQRAGQTAKAEAIFKQIRESKSTAQEAKPLLDILR